MATAYDHYQLVYRLPEHEPTQYRPSIGLVLSNFGVPVSRMNSGWCQVGVTNNTFLSITFSVPKNTFTDAQILQLSNDVLGVIGTQLFRVDKTSMESLL